MGAVDKAVAAASCCSNVMMVMALLVASRVDPVEWEKKQIG